jgi:hypothetical protein
MNVDVNDTDPRWSLWIAKNEVLSERGSAWPLVHESLQENHSRKWSPNHGAAACMWRPSARSSRVFRHTNKEKLRKLKDSVAERVRFELMGDFQNCQ